MLCVCCLSGWLAGWLEFGSGRWTAHQSRTSTKRERERIPCSRHPPCRHQVCEVYNPAAAWKRHEIFEKWISRDKPPESIIFVVPWLRLSTWSIATSFIPSRQVTRRQPTTLCFISELGSRVTNFIDMIIILLIENMIKHLFKIKRQLSMIDNTTHSDMACITPAGDQSYFEVIGNPDALCSETAVTLFLVIKSWTPQHYFITFLN